MCGIFICLVYNHKIYVVSLLAAMECMYYMDGYILIEFIGFWMT